MRRGPLGIASGSGSYKEGGGHRGFVGGERRRRRGRRCHDPGPFHCLRRWSPGLDRSRGRLRGREVLSRLCRGTFCDVGLVVVVSGWGLVQ